MTVVAEAGSPRGVGRPELRDLAAWGTSADDEKVALLLWGKLSGPAKSIMRVLMSQPEKEFSGEQLAERCGLEKGKFGVAGALGWPGRYSAAMGHKHPVQYREDAQDGQARYSMTADVAKLFLAADEESK